MAGLANVDPSCAICGAPSDPECPHESQRLELALNQAMYRWSGFDRIRAWVLDKARNSILADFAELKARRWTTHVGNLQTIPLFTLYQRHNGNPPLNVSQMQMVQHDIATFRAEYQTRVDEDWRRCCMKYPETLDYFFDLVDLDMPEDDDIAVSRPTFGVVGGGGAGAARPAQQRLIKARRGSRGSSEPGNGRRKKQRRRPSRGRTPPRR